MVGGCGHRGHLHRQLRRHVHRRIRGLGNRACLHEWRQVCDSRWGHCDRLECMKAFRADYVQRLLTGHLPSRSDSWSGVGCRPLPCIVWVDLEPATICNIGRWIRARQFSLSFKNILEGVYYAATCTPVHWDPR